MVKDSLKVSKLQLALLAATLFGGPMALNPSIAMPFFDFSSLRIGLYQLVVIVFFCLSLPIIIKRLPQLLNSRLFLIVSSFIILIIGIGLATTLVPARTLIYSLALVWLLLIGLAAALTFKEISPQQKQLLIYLGLWSGIVFGTLAIVQLIAASFSPTAFGTLCEGCKAEVFGFPRINGLAAEPQFFANALLPALLLALTHGLKSRLGIFSLLFSTLAITLTLSRGAFLALIVVFLIYVVFITTKNKSVRSLFKPFGLMFLGAFLGLSLLVISAVSRYPSTPHITHNTIVSMTEQLTLGVISIPQKTVITAPEQTPIAPPAEQQAPEDFTPAGLVEASADDRLAASDLAIEAWSSSIKTLIFGVGLGNLGSFLNIEMDYAVPIDQTVYVFYVLLLSSVGLLGLLALLLPLGFSLICTFNNRHEVFGMFGLLLTLAFVLQFWFFGSLINTVHCFAWIGIFLYNLQKK